MNIKRLVLITLSVIMALALLLLTSTIVAALKPITSDFANNSLGGNQSTNIYFPIIMKQNIGTEAAPIKMLFVLPGNSVILNQAGEQIEQDLHQLTGLFFEVSEPPTYKATIEIMCASPNDTIGFIPSVGYVLANQLCGVNPGLASVLYGWNVFWSEFLVGLVRGSCVSLQLDQQACRMTFSTLLRFLNQFGTYPHVGSESRQSLRTVSLIHAGS